MAVDQADMPKASSKASASGPINSRAKDYQDKAETRDSQLKAIWDGRMSGLKNNSISYQKAFVLLLSWHESVDDLHTGEEVDSLANIFETKFQYTTVKRTLTKDDRLTAQVQVNRYLAEFVFDYDDVNTLLIVYYAGHGGPGKDRGSLKLLGSISNEPGDESELHEVVWSSAEHNIKDTRADVLVIFDCCHAGQLELNVRSAFTRRAFEFLAATSANSTTRKPGKDSFTSALIWSLSHLVVKNQEGFSTQELFRTICQAPGFPSDSQTPRLLERGAASLRKIALCPLTQESIKKAEENAEREVDDDQEGSLRQDLLLRFIFDREIKDHMVEEIARHVGALIQGGDIKAKAVLWEGTNFPRAFQIKENLAAQEAIKKFLNILDFKRKRSVGSAPTSLIGIAPEAAEPGSNHILEAVSAFSPPSVDESSVGTPNRSYSAGGMEIGEDQGVSQEDLQIKLDNQPPRNLKRTMPTSDTTSSYSQETQQNKRSKRLR